MTIQPKLYKFVDAWIKSLNKFTQFRPKNGIIEILCLSWVTVSKRYSIYWQRSAGLKIVYKVFFYSTGLMASMSFCVPFLSECLIVPLLICASKILAICLNSKHMYFFYCYLNFQLSRWSLCLSSCQFNYILLNKTTLAPLGTIADTDINICI